MQRLSYATLGSADKPPVLLMHGFMSSNLQWALNQEALAQHFYLVMIEMWDHGESPNSESQDDYSPDRYAEQVKYICDELSLGSVALVGHSLGSAVLIQFALHYPEYVCGILFTNAKMVIADEKISLERLDVLSDVLSEPMIDDPEKRKAFSRKLPMHPIHSRRLPEGLKPAFIDAADRVPLEGLQNSRQNAQALNCRTRLRELKVPVLIVNGVFEKALQPYIDGLRGRHENITVIDVQAGHSPNLDDAEKFNKIALDFLPTCFR